MLERILIADDDPVALETLSEVLQREGFPVSVASDARRALELLATEPHALLLADIRMPDGDGLDLLQQVQRLHPGTDIVLMTGSASLDRAIDALARGAADFLTKPLRPKEIVARVRSILQRRRLEAELHALQGELRSRYEMHNLVAHSPRMAALVAALHRLQESAAPIVLVGEEGSGRRFLARAIHCSGPRRAQEFAVLDTRVPPADGVEAALFGSIGASGRRRCGLLDRLQGGTLHLVSIESLEPEGQTRLAALLAERRSERGAPSARERRADSCRLILSTEAPPSDLLASGRLVPELGELRDLVTIAVPPLRSRVEDLPGLVAAFVEQYSLEHGQSLRVGPRVIELLAAHEFPGNARQLFAVLCSGATLSLDGVLSAENLERSLRHSNPGAAAPIADHLGDREYQVVLRAVQRNPGQLDQAARELGVSRTTLWRRMRKHGIRLVAL